MSCERAPTDGRAALGGELPVAAASTCAVEELSPEESAAPDASRASSFSGTERFQLIRLLGAGGMGVVFAAYDRECRCEVALKLLPTLNPTARLRLKTEFRNAAGIHHPNLVSLGELIEDASHLFFTMELVVGVDWQSHLAGAKSSTPQSRHGRCRDEITQADPSLPPTGKDPGAISNVPLHPNAPRPDGARLRSALRQLTEGLMCLHAHGKVHRDVKPSNVLVADNGRVVLLDFGLAVDVSRQARTEFAWQQGAGTALYMSPEQALGKPIGPASDWYSVGVLLYQALAGRPPFIGGTSEILDKKRAQDPRPPATIAEDVPDDLDRLCVALLARDPHERADGADIVATLRNGGTFGGALPAAPGIGISRFFGRREELATLERAFAAVRSEPLRIVVQGESGVGKTALVREFGRRVASRGNAHELICTGVCSERESIAFKALDGIAEGLADELPAIIDAESRLPSGAAKVLELARAAAFALPALARALPLAAGNGFAPTDPWIKRAIAFQGLRDLLALFAKHRRLVVCIDDWQWVDADSVRLLSDVLAAPGAPPVLLVLTTRGALSAELPGPSERIQLDNLEREAAEDLATELLREIAEPSRGPAAREIAAESLGHPLFIAALARQALAGEDLANARPNLDQAIWSRVEALPSVARRMAEIVAVSRTPLTLGVLQLALADSGRAHHWPEVSGAILELTRDNLARADGMHASAAIDCFHSRVASSILARLPASIRRARHRALALALEQSESSDFESMSEHWAEAQQPQRAAEYALRAADAAAHHLAFDRAARLYRRFLELSPSPDGWPPFRSGLRRRSRTWAAGERRRTRYLVASDEGGERRLELQRLAADQLFRSGYVDDAIRLIERVFPSVGLRFPEVAATGALMAGGTSAPDSPSRHRLHPASAGDVAVGGDRAGRRSVDRRGGTVDRRQLEGRLCAERQPAPGSRARRTVPRRESPGRRSGLRGDGGGPRANERRRDARARLRDRREARGALRLRIRPSGSLLRALPAIRVHRRPRRGRGGGDRIQGAAGHGDVGADQRPHAPPLVSFHSGDLGEIQRRVPLLVREAESRGDLYGATSLRLGICNCAWLVDDDGEERVAIFESRGRELALPRGPPSARLELGRLGQRRPVRWGRRARVCARAAVHAGAGALVRHALRAAAGGARLAACPRRTGSGRA